MTDAPEPDWPYKTVRKKRTKPIKIKLGAETEEFLKDLLDELDEQFLRDVGTMSNSNFCPMCGKLKTNGMRGSKIVSFCSICE